MNLEGHEDVNLLNKGVHVNLGKSVDVILYNDKDEIK